LLRLARARAIDLAQIPLPALVVQLTIAMAHSPPRLPLGQKANWLVMAAWLLLLRSHLLLPPPPKNRRWRERARPVTA
jgi:chromatin segregation and condensation protein Rec8/ScpA/Scc1 (kleisin family)